MDNEKIAVGNQSPDSGSPPAAYRGETTVHQENWRQRFISSFKRDPNQSATGIEYGPDGKERVWDAEAAIQATANSPLSRRLKGRHLQMIAIGGSIGMRSARGFH